MNSFKLQNRAAYDSIGGNLIRIRPATDKIGEAPRVEDEALPAQRGDYAIFFMFAATSFLFVSLGVWKAIEILEAL